MDRNRVVVGRVAGVRGKRRDWSTGVRRWWTILLLCVLLGAVMNVLVAWGCEVIPLPEERRWIERQVGWPMPVPAGLANRPDFHSEWRMFGRCQSSYACAVAREPGDTSQRGYAGLTVWTCGWPAASLSRWQWYSNGTDFLDLPGAAERRYLWAVRLPNRLTPQGLARGSGWLSLCPLWPGFVINTLVYGAALGVPVVGIPALRRTWRRRRGLCPSCGYDRTGVLASAACPECGAGAVAPP